VSARSDGSAEDGERRFRRGAIPLVAKETFLGEGMMRWTLAIAALAAAVGLLVAQEKKQQTLCYKFKKGETLKYRLTGSMKEERDDAGTKSGSERSLQAVVSVAVKETKADGATLAVKGEKFKCAVVTKGPDGTSTVTVDSEKWENPKPDDPQRFDKVGLKGALEAEAEDDVTARHLKFMYALGGYGLQVSAGVVVLPEKAVKVGASWEETIECTVGSTDMFKLKFKYELASVEGGVALIKGELVGAESAFGDAVKVTRSKGAVEARLDVEKGCLKSVKARIELETGADSPAGEGKKAIGKILVEEGLEEAK